MKFKRKIRILLEVDGVQTPIMFYRYDGEDSEDPQLTHHMNNVQDAVKAALQNIDIEFEEPKTDYSERDE